MSPDRLKVGSYGYLSFTLKKKYKHDAVETGFKMMAEIMENDDGHVLARDNDGMIYLIPKKQIRDYKQRMKIHHENN